MDKFTKALNHLEEMQKQTSKSIENSIALGREKFVKDYDVIMVIRFLLEFIGLDKRNADLRPFQKEMLYRTVINDIIPKSLENAAEENQEEAEYKKEFMLRADEILKQLRELK